MTATASPVQAPPALPIEHGRIRQLLPHRHPVLLVDRVLELEPMTRIVAVKAITGSEPCYAKLAEDLAPSRYAYPPGLIIESFGQTGALLWLSSVGETQGTLIFAAARDVEFFRPVLPGDLLRHEARVDQIVGANAFLSGETWVGEEMVARVGSAIAVVRPTDGLGGGGG